MLERVKETKCGGGAMPERVKKTECGGLQKQIEWGYAGEGKEDKMRGGGVAVKNGGGDHKKNLRGGGSVENYVFFRGGLDIQWNSPL